MIFRGEGETRARDIHAVAHKVEVMAAVDSSACSTASIGDAVSGRVRRDDFEVEGERGDVDVDGEVEMAAVGEHCAEAERILLGIYVCAAHAALCGVVDAGDGGVERAGRAETHVCGSCLGAGSALQAKVTHGYREYY